MSYKLKPRVAHHTENILIPRVTNLITVDAEPKAKPKLSKLKYHLTPRNITVTVTTEDDVEENVVPVEVPVKETAPVAGPSGLNRTAPGVIILCII